MSESKSNEVLIGSLEQSLRQTRKSLNALGGERKELEAEMKGLEQQIEMHEKTEQAIHSLLSEIRSGKHPSKMAKNLRDDDDYEILADVQNVVYRNQNNREDQYVNNREDQFYNNREDQYVNNRDNRRNNPNNRRYTNDNYRDNSAGYNNNNQSRNERSRRGSSTNIEPNNQRFADRTITQACTLLLRESGQPLHVNDLYKLLVAGGFEFKGNNPTISIAVSLNRNRRFEKIAPSTFDLVLRDASQNAA
jgi:hypothetical protein